MKRTKHVLKLMLLCMAMAVITNCNSDDDSTVEEEIVNEEEQPETPRIFMIPVTHHISRTDDGNNPATDAARIAKVMEDINRNYLDANIQFRTEEIRFLDNTAWNEQFEKDDDFGEDRALLEFEDPNTLNLFYFFRIGDTEEGEVNSTVTATAHFPGEGNNVKLTPSAFALDNFTTTTHEIGHYFGLFHIDDDFVDDQGRTELVDGSNCILTGDGICDTPASPVLDDTLVGDDCNYIGTLTDANGEQYTPDLTNYMSSLSIDDSFRIACRRNFSPQQIEAIVVSIRVDRPYLIGEPFCQFIDFVTEYETINSNTGGAPFTDQAPVDIEEEAPIAGEEEEEDMSNIGFAFIDFDFNNENCESVIISQDFLNLGCFNGDDITAVMTFTPENPESNQGTVAIVPTNFDCLSESGAQTLTYTIEATGTYDIETRIINLNYTLTLNGTAETGTLLINPLDDDEFIEEEFEGEEGEEGEDL